MTSHFERPDRGYNKYTTDVWGLYNLSNEDEKYHAYLRMMYRGKCGLRNVPRDMRTREMCVEAVTWRAGDMKYVPKEIVDYKFCLEVMGEDTLNGEPMNFIPGEFKTREMYETALRRGNFDWNNVPKEMKDPDLCELAAHDWLVMDDMTEYEQTDKVCLASIKHNRSNIEHVKNHTRFILWLLQNHMDLMLQLDTPEEWGVGMVEYW